MKARPLLSLPAAAGIRYGSRPRVICNDGVATTDETQGQEVVAGILEELTAFRLMRRNRVQPAKIRLTVADYYRERPASLRAA